MRCLLGEALKVRALVRDELSENAAALQRIGAQLATGDLDDFSSVEPILRDTPLVVVALQSFDDRGRCQPERMLAHGRAVADAAFNAQVPRIIYVSCLGATLGSRVPHLAAHAANIQYMRQRGMAVFELQPALLFDWLDDPTLSPRLTTFKLMQDAVGAHTTLPWVSARDVGNAIASLVLEPRQPAPAPVVLAHELSSLSQASAALKVLRGKAGRGFAVPLWLLRPLFRLLAGPSLPLWWAALAEQKPGPSSTFATTLGGLVKEPLTLKGYLKTHSHG